jgi:hypothetical protein
MISRGNLHDGTRGRAGVACALLLALGSAWAFGSGDGDGKVFGGGGGDTVGSLPLMSGPGDPGSWDPNALPLPIFALEGTPLEVEACILDAYPTGPDGACRVVRLGQDRVRYEFHGRMTVVLDRPFLRASALLGQVVVATPFGGGVAAIEVGGHARAVQTLEPGVTDLRLRTLERCGALDQGVVWHAVTLLGEHRRIELGARGNLVFVQQRD